jgi:hypothetical protein
MGISQIKHGWLMKGRIIESRVNREIPEPCEKPRPLAYFGYFAVSKNSQARDLGWNSWIDCAEFGEDADSQHGRTLADRIT